MLVLALSFWDDTPFQSSGGTIPRMVGISCKCFEIHKNNSIHNKLDNYFLVHGYFESQEESVQVSKFRVKNNVKRNTILQTTRM